MRTLILNRDLKRLFEGAAGVAAAGLMLGAFMHPTLRPDPLGAPRMEMGVAGARAAYAPDQAATWTSYGGRLPDYVVGTDSLKPPPAYRDDPTLVVDTADEPERPETYQRRQVAWQEPPREPVAYPSTSGGVPYESDLPRAPEPPDEDDEPSVY
jgi:hypothetical protein